MKRNLIISFILALVMVVSICLKSVWGGFIYFSLSSLTLLGIFWFINLIINFLEDYYYSFEEDFKEYKAEMINSTALTSETFEENRPLYIKKYKKSLRRYKFIDICKMLFLLMVVVICIVVMAKGNLY